MAIRFSHPIAVINILELVLSVTIAGLISGAQCLLPSDETIENAIWQISFTSLQYNAGIVYGYLLIHAILVAAIFVQGSFPGQLRLVISGAGSILHLASCVLMIIAGTEGYCSAESHWYARTVIAGLVALALVIVLVIDFLMHYFVWRRVDELK